MSDGVLIGLASIPEREGSLQRTLKSLAPQADKIALSLNEYAQVPSWLARFPNVEATIRSENLGDAEKFAAVDEWDGVVCTCDDDILYPSDYVARILEGLEKWPGRAVSFHGGVTLGFNGTHVTATGRRVRCLGDLEEDDTELNVLGTGCLGYDARSVPVWRDSFRYP